MGHFFSKYLYNTIHNYLNTTISQIYIYTGIHIIIVKIEINVSQKHNKIGLNFRIIEYCIGANCQTNVTITRAYIGHE